MSHNEFRRGLCSNIPLSVDLRRSQAACADGRDVDRRRKLARVVATSKSLARRGMRDCEWLSRSRDGNCLYLDKLIRVA